MMVSWFGFKIDHDMRAILLTVFLTLIALVGDAQIGQLGVHRIGSTNAINGVGDQGITVHGGVFALVPGIPPTNQFLLHDATSALLLNDATGATLINDNP